MERNRIYNMDCVEEREKYIADTFEKVGLAEIVREQGNDTLTNAVQSAMIELSKVVNTDRGEDERIRACIGMVLTDAEERRFTDYGTSLKDCLSWLEAQRDLAYRLAVIQKVSFHPLVMQTRQEWSEGYIRQAEGRLSI